jgi:hypothetical protein
LTVTDALRDEDAILRGNRLWLGTGGEGDREVEPVNQSGSEAGPDKNSERAGMNDVDGSAIDDDAEAVVNMSRTTQGKGCTGRDAAVSAADDNW